MEVFVCGREGEGDEEGKVLEIGKGRFMDGYRRLYGWEREVLGDVEWRGGKGRMRREGK